MKLDWAQKLGSHSALPTRKLSLFRSHKFDTVAGNVVVEV